MSYSINTTLLTSSAPSISTSILNAEPYVWCRGIKAIALLGHYNNGDFSFYETNNVTRRNVVDDYSHICCVC